MSRSHLKKEMLKSLLRWAKNELICKK